MIWNYELEDIIKGYAQENGFFKCVICQEKFEKGRIYRKDDKFYEAEAAAANHIKDIHGNMAAYLLNQELNMTGLTEIQRQVLTLILNGRGDQEIGKELGIAQSTVRNHRFKIREKEKQAKLFLALMSSLEKETNSRIGNSDAGELVEIHSSAAMVDDRYNITEKERAKTIAVYMDEETGLLKQFPAREKKKVIVLSEIIKNFKKGIKYTEPEVDRLLKRIYEADYPSIRRGLIEYGFMDRSSDCSIYRVKE